MPETGRLERVEQEISELKDLYHSQDKYMAGLSSDVKYLTSAVSHLSKTVETLDGNVRKASEEIIAILPKLEIERAKNEADRKVSIWWGNVYKNLFIVAVTTVITLTITFLFDFFRVKHGP
jgi:septal ring factor EnvC (AmiA/AmiB activator)